MAHAAKKLRYHGHVQGVGFRRRTELLARDLPVTGYVRNCSDGTVELVAAGDEGDVAKLLQRIQEKLGANIDRVEESGLPALATFPDFRIRLD